MTAALWINVTVKPIATHAAALTDMSIGVVRGTRGPYPTIFRISSHFVLLTDCIPNKILLFA